VAAGLEVVQQLRFFGATQSRQRFQFDSNFFETDKVN
jgi:hypothetical protein